MKSLILLALMAVSVSAFAQSGKITQAVAAKMINKTEVWDAPIVMSISDAKLDFAAYAAKFGEAYPMKKGWAAGWTFDSWGIINGVFTAKFTYKNTVWTVTEKFDMIKIGFAALNYPLVQMRNTAGN